MTSLVVFTQIACFSSLRFVCVSWSKKMSSESSSERSVVVSRSEEEDGGDYFELNGSFAIEANLSGTAKMPMMKTKVAFCPLF